MTARFLNTFLYISVFCILHFKKLPFGSEQLSDLGKLQCSIEGVLIPGCPTISSTWQLLKTSLVMKSFLIHRQSHHRMFKVPRCPQHSKYLFWNVSQRLHLLWSRLINKYRLDSVGHISCCLCNLHSQLGTSLLEMKSSVFEKNARLSSTALFACPRKLDGFIWLTLWLCCPLTSSEKKARKLTTTEWIVCGPSSPFSLNGYRETRWKQIMKWISNHGHL